MQKIVGGFDVQLEMGKPLFEWHEIPLKKNWIPKI